MEEAQTVKRDYLLPGSILIAAVLIAGSIFYVMGGREGGSQEDKEKEAASLTSIPLPPVGGRDVVLGEANAPVTLVEYGDYQCPFCARFFKETEPLIRERYIKTGQVNMVYRNFPFLGPESFVAAEAAECAKDQKQFWPYHDLLFEEEYKDEERNPRNFENNGNLNRELFLKLAGELKLDMTQFTACVDGGTYGDLIVASAEEARRVGVDSTPTTFLNRKMITAFIEGRERSAGALSFEDTPVSAGIKTIIENALEQAAP